MLVNNDHFMQDKKSTIVGFDERFTELMQNSGLTKKELSQVLQMSDSAIINYKRGRIPKADELLRISRYFNVSVDWLLTGEEMEFEKLPQSAWEMRCRRAEDKLAIALEALKGIIRRIE